MDLSFITAFFKDRVFGHLPSTIAGGIAAVAVALATYTQSLSVDPKWSFALYAVSALLFAIGAAYKAPAAPPKGFAGLGYLIGLALIVTGILLAAPARADDPRFGGCLKNGTTCFGPSVSLSVVAIDLKDGSVTAGVSPGVGYGVVLYSDRWYKLGFAGYASFRDTATGQRVVPSMVISFAEYLRFGVGQQIGGGGHPFGILAIGADFGSVPTVAVK